MSVLLVSLFDPLVEGRHAHLISNDDGVHSPGIVALAHALAAHHEVLVVAPDRDHSGAQIALL